MKNEFLALPIRLILATAFLSLATTGCTPKRSVAMPPAEAQFIDTLNSFASQYNSASNALQRGSLRSARMAGLAKACGDRAITGWVGTLTEITTTPDGNFAIAIQLPDSDIVLRTMTSSFADVSFKTLIPKDSPLHDRLAALSKGQMVNFTGTFLFGNDYLKELSTSEKDSLTKPAFLVQFTDISQKP